MQMWLALAFRLIRECPLLTRAIRPGALREPLGAGDKEKGEAIRVGGAQGGRRACCPGC